MISVLYGRNTPLAFACKHKPGHIVCGRVPCYQAYSSFQHHFSQFRTRMTKEFCLVHANCQGKPLLERLRLCPEFTARFDSELIADDTGEPVPDELLSRCSLFLYQRNEPAPDVLLGKLPDSARSLCIPNMSFSGYWPTWSGSSGFNCRCPHLDELIATSLPLEEVVLRYIDTDIAARHDLLSLAADTLKREREREAHTPIKYLDIISRDSRSEQLFNTADRPRKRLMNHAARGVLAELGFAPPDESALDALGQPFPEFEQPIDPKVAAHFGWDFAGADREFTIYGRRMTFARWVSNYVFAKRAGIADFFGFLQGNNIAI